MKRVAIVGGGIAGLAIALELSDRAAEVEDGLEVVVLEARDRVGGNIRTDRVDGYTIEAGPNGFLDNAPATLDLVRRIGLQDRLQPASDSAARRFVYRDGRLHALPAGPMEFLKSPVLSLRGRARVLGEPFARGRPEGVDESVYDFAARRIGREAASVLVDAMVSGVFAGDVRRLSLGSAFPRMAAMEAEHGSLVKAMIASRRGPAGPGGTLTSFDAGMSVLVEGLAGALGDRVRTRSRVVSLDRRPGAWRLALDGGDAVEAHAVVLAVPSGSAAALLGPVDAELAAPVADIPAAGLAVIALGYRAEDLGGADVDGFGFLVPRGEGPRILGCLYGSSIFPRRSPDGRVLLRCMIGGAHDAAAVHADESELVRVVRHDLERTLGLRASPELVRVYRWPNGIAQYTVGHGERIGRAETRLRAHPGLLLAGSSYYGVSMNACIGKAPAQASALLQYLRS